MRLPHSRLGRGGFPCHAQGRCRSGAGRSSASTRAVTSHGHTPLPARQAGRRGRVCIGSAGPRASATGRYGPCRERRSLFPIPQCFKSVGKATAETPAPSTAPTGVLRLSRNRRFPATRRALLLRLPALKTADHGYSQPFPSHGTN